MRILVVGAGAVGGYFGGRLLEAKRDVTFLVRPRRAAELAKTGLVIKSRWGDVSLAAPHVLAEEIKAPFDLVILASKAYGLDQTMESVAPAVGPGTAILPLLNGMRQLDQLSARFGEQHVLGGLCLISATLDDEGAILHLNDLHGLVFGERDAANSSRIDAIKATFAGAKFEGRASAQILQEMWEKWVFIATGAGITCLMRATIGDIVAAGGSGLATGLFDECAAIAAQAGFPPGNAFAQRSRTTFTTPGSPLTASMFRDMQRGAPTEADHVIGDLLQRGEPAATPLLQIVYTHLKAYEARRQREAAPTR